MPTTAQRAGSTKKQSAEAPALTAATMTVL